MCRIFRKGWERGKVGEGGVIFKEFRDIDGIVPEVNGREGCWVGRAVEEGDGGVIRQGAVGAGWRGIFFRVNSVLVGFEFGAIVGA